jgi:hypothetical protein
MKRILLAALMLVAGAPTLRAEEQPIELKEAPGHDTVENTCSICHSLDYIRMNSPFPSAALWTAEVNKMINVFGAPVEPADAKVIIDYLIKNYGS